MHNPAEPVVPNIYECGLTEPEGRPHRYRHNRLRDAWVIWLSIKGEKEWAVEDQVLLEKAPALCCTRPGICYRISTLPPHLNRVIYALVLQPEDWSPTGFREVWPGHFRVQLDGHPHLPDILDAFREMHRWSRTFVPGAEKLAVNALDRGLLLAGIPTAPGPAGSDDRLHGITGYIFEHMDEGLNVKKLAQAVNLSPSRFAHLFPRAFGIGPMGYVEHVRMEEAKAQLAGGSSPVNLIARRVGYENEFYFSRRFKLYAGMSPSAYRASVKKD